MKRVLLLLVAGVFAGQAHAGLFTDEKTAKQLKELEGRVSLLEDNSNQSSRAMMGLQSQIDTLNETVRKLQGENEELQHDLQDAEKRQKDFYIDLDTRMRKLESAASAVAAAAPPAPAPIDPVAENRDFNAAYAQFKAQVAGFHTWIHGIPDQISRLHAGAQCLLPHGSGILRPA